MSRLAETLCTLLWQHLCLPVVFGCRPARWLRILYEQSTSCVIRRHHFYASMLPCRGKHSVG